MIKFSAAVAFRSASSSSSSSLASSTSKMALRQFSSAAELGVLHDAKKNLFYIPLSDNSKVKAVLEYRFVGEKHVDMTHTGVPVELRGRGIAAQLAAAAFDYAVENRLRVTPSCSYIQKFVDETENQDYKKTLT